MDLKQWKSMIYLLIACNWAKNSMQFGMKDMSGLRQAIENGDANIYVSSQNWAEDSSANYFRFKRKISCS